MKKVLPLIKSKKAELYLDSIMVIFVVFLGLALFISVLPAIVKKQQLDMVAKEAARFVEIEGRTDGLESEINDLGERVGCIPDRILDVDTTYFDGDKIQLREQFSIALEKDITIGAGLTSGITITVKSTASGRSEVYWK